jgi:hypothetical protein
LCTADAPAEVAAAESGGGDGHGVVVGVDLVLDSRLSCGASLIGAPQAAAAVVAGQTFDGGHGGRPDAGAESRGSGGGGGGGVLMKSDAWAEATLASCCRGSNAELRKSSISSMMQSCFSSFGLEGSCLGSFKGISSSRLG